MGLMEQIDNDNLFFQIYINIFNVICWLYMIDFIWFYLYLILLNRGYISTLQSFTKVQRTQRKKYFVEVHPSATNLINFTTKWKRYWGIYPFKPIQLPK